MAQQAAGTKCPLKDEGLAVGWQQVRKQEGNRDVLIQEEGKQ